MLNLEITLMDRIQARRLEYYGHVIRVSNKRRPLIALDESTKGYDPKDVSSKPWVDCCREICSLIGTSTVAKKAARS